MHAQDIEGYSALHYLAQILRNKSLNATRSDDVYEVIDDAVEIAGLLIVAGIDASVRSWTVLHNLQLSAKEMMDGIDFVEGFVEMLQ